MQILQDDHERSAAREALKELPHRPEELAGRSRALGVARQLGDSLRDDGCVLVAFEQPFDCRLRPFGGDLPHDLGEREVCRSLAVRDAAADER